MELNGTKIWIGGDNSLGEAVQHYAISRGWSWGKAHGPKEIKKSVNFIQFRVYSGNRRMFCGADGKTSREAFENLQKVEISPLDIGYTVAKPISRIAKGTKVKLIGMKGFPGEPIYMEKRLFIDGIYTVKSYKEHYSNNPTQEPAIELMSGSDWYPLSAFSIIQTPEYKPPVMGSKITNVADLLVGMWVTFEKKQQFWNSSGGGKDPKDIPNDHYPYTGVITSLPGVDGILIDGKWGFSRGESIKSGVIRVATQEEVVNRSDISGIKKSQIKDFSGSMGTAIDPSTPTVKYDPTNIRVDRISKAAPKKTEFIKIEPLPLLNVPQVGRKSTKEIPKITSYLTRISI